ncbi:hypothetical protein L7F22_031845 [Adiantum nelumboides]|nr:hypothetical protein [Adiantum nelumboides]
MPPMMEMSDMKFFVMLMLEAGMVMQGHADLVPIANKAVIMPTLVTYPYVTHFDGGADSFDTPATNRLAEVVHAQSIDMVAMDSEIEDLNLQLTRIKNMKFSSKFDVMEGVLNDGVILNGLYDVAPDVNGCADAEKMVLIDYNASILQVLVDNQVVFLEDASIFLCAFVDEGNEGAVIIS